MFPIKMKSQFKKKLFSFIYPGQSKKNVLVQRKKQVLSRILSKSTKLIKSIDKFSYQLFHQLFQSRQFNLKLSDINQQTLSKNSRTTSNYQDDLVNVHYKLAFDIKGDNTNALFMHNEVRIPRVRFKPGYQRI